MPRKAIIPQSQFPYAITARSNNKEWFDLPMSSCWQIFVDKIRTTSERSGFKTHAFVLMSNHFHWLLSTPQANIGFGARYFLTETSRAIARSTGRINKIYGARYKASLIGSPIYYANSYRYIYQNPLRAGLCENVFDYPWSSLSASQQIVVEPCPGFEEFIPTDRLMLNEWLNKIPDSVFNECMRKGLKKREFEFPRHPTKKTSVSGLEFL